MSKSIAVNKQIRRVSLEADYLFMRCIPHLDRDGRLDGEPEAVKATVCPLRPEITPEIVERCLGELDKEGLVVWYEVHGERWLEFPGFKGHQNGMKYDRERESRIPSSKVKGAKRVSNESPTSRTNSGPTPDLVPDVADQVPDVADEVLPSEVKRSEVKLSQVKLSSAAAPNGAAPKNWVGDFSQLWRDKIGHITEGHLGKALTGCVSQHGVQAVRDALAEYADAPPNPRGKKVEWFAADIVRWIAEANEPLEHDGVLTAKGRRFMGVAS